MQYLTLSPVSTADASSLYLTAPNSAATLSLLFSHWLTYVWSVWKMFIIYFYTCMRWLGNHYCVFLRSNTFVKITPITLHNISQLLFSPFFNQSLVTPVVKLWCKAYDRKTVHYPGSQIKKRSTERTHPSLRGARTTSVGSSRMDDSSSRAGSSIYKHRQRGRDTLHRRTTNRHLADIYINTLWFKMHPFCYMLALNFQWGCI